MLPYMVENSIIMHNNLTTVQQIYNCFAQGDVPGILSKLSDDVTFFNGSDPRVASFGGTFNGKNEVIRFFQNLGSTTQTTYFEPSDFREAGNQVVNQVRHDGVVNVTGRPFSVTVLFTWTFNEAGQVTDWKGAGDFSSINDAFL